MTEEPEFKLLIRFHFNEHGKGRWNKFIFPDNGHRRVPMKLAGIEGLNTVGMWIGKSETFYKNDTIEADCRIISPELFENKMQIGAKGQLWDSGFFADIEVIDIYKLEYKKDPTINACEPRVLGPQR